MGTRVKVIGTCPYCNRYVSRDLRPINTLTPRDAKRISQLINAEPPAPIQLDSEEESEVRVSRRKETTQEELQTNAARDAEADENSLEELTENILNLVEQEFARSPECSGASRISEENAGLIVAMLTEEQRIIDKIERRALKRDVKEPPAKRRRC
ncbi:uncharacterized protein LOC121467122 [Drosophila elegans]|uniref:uncharacterized protein LOC121467122 n=1 Tax=Drosophila elegans TaxID=30023 RepID=UPI001BC86253|nr:uncharacterized protein LOC121467122 [Drosophila elegans]